MYNTGEIEHKHFYDIVDELNEGDALILNDTKVLPARLYGQKEGTGGAIEFLHTLFGICFYLQVYVLYSEAEAFLRVYPKPPQILPHTQT